MHYRVNILQIEDDEVFQCIEKVNQIVIVQLLAFIF